MKTRILVAVIGLPVLIAVLLFLPVWAAALVIGLVCALAVYELLYATGLLKKPRIVAVAAVMAVAVCMCPVWELPDIAVQTVVVAFVAYLFTELVLAKTQLGFSLICLALFAGLGMPWLFSSIIRILNLENGRYLVLIPFAMTMLPDSGAYFVGCRFGKHKLAPEISPKKTVEGVLGGIGTGVLGMVLYGLALQLLGLEVSYLLAVLYGLVGSVGSVIGDLVFSTIKRQSGIKDFGDLLPGHGGALDRFDSAMLVAPLTELLLILLPLTV